MNYLALVSHGTFAAGLHNALSMLMGERDDIFSVGLEDGMSADQFAEKFAAKLQVVKPEDKLIVIGDLIGGSPLTNAINQVCENGLEAQTIVFGGMNLAMALTAAMQKDMCDFDEIRASLPEESKNIIQEYPLNVDDEDDAEDDI